MPKVIDETEREENRFRDWVRGECKRQKVMQSYLAEELLISDISMSKKMNGKSHFTDRDIITICSILGEYTFGGAS